jgi:hypothetical protein
VGAIERLIEILKGLGPTGVGISIGVLTIFILIHLAKQIQGLRSSAISTKEKPFDQLSKLLQEKDLLEKQGLLLEQIFANHFKFILGADEIRHILKSKRQSEAIRDLKYCRSMFKFDEELNKYIYVRKNPLNRRILISNINYWVSASMAIFVTAHSLAPSNWPLLILSAIFCLSAYQSMVTSRALYAAKRISEGYYGPN